MEPPRAAPLLLAFSVQAHRQFHARTVRIHTNLHLIHQTSHQEYSPAVRQHEVLLLKRIAQGCGIESLSLIPHNDEKFPRLHLAPYRHVFLGILFIPMDDCIVDSFGHRHHQFVHLFIIEAKGIDDFLQEGFHLGDRGGLTRKGEIEAVGLGRHVKDPLLEKVLQMERHIGQLLC